MSTKQTPTPAEPAAPGPVPARLTAAAALTALEGLALAGLGVWMLLAGVLGHVDSVQQAETGGVTLIALAALPLAAARGLRLRRKWSRGPAMITQVMALPVAWTLYQTGGAMIAAAAALAAAAGTVAWLLVHPETTLALTTTATAGAE
ncbi:hypothetical protein [Streptomyces sp. NRRL S-87]|uniref:hypothetical protein n=1 Tax=Streptomyces sp. NRRL S-87 TaxID=1463920 RepID=UPI0004BFC358|nr:hypothetical protein [Streptomyces sp. NRRL S-87]